MMQVGKDPRWSERRGIFLIEEYAGKNPKLKVSINLQDIQYTIYTEYVKNYTTPEYALIAVRNWCEMSTEQVKRMIQLRNL